MKDMELACLGVVDEGASHVGTRRRLAGGGVLEALDDGCLAAAVLAQDQSQGVGSATVAIAEGNHLEKSGTI